MSDSCHKAIRQLVEHQNHMLANGSMVYRSSMVQHVGFRAGCVLECDSAPYEETVKYALIE